MSATTPTPPAELPRSRMSLWKPILIGVVLLLFGPPLLKDFFGDPPKPKFSDSEAYGLGFVLGENNYDAFGRGICQRALDKAISDGVLTTPETGKGQWVLGCIDAESGNPPQYPDDVKAVRAGVSSFINSQ